MKKKKMKPGGSLSVRFSYRVSSGNWIVLQLQHNAVHPMRTRCLAYLASFHVGTAAWTSVSISCHGNDAPIILHPSSRSASLPAVFLISCTFITHYPWTTVLTGRNTQVTSRRFLQLVPRPDVR